MYIALLLSVLLWPSKLIGQYPYDWQHHAQDYRLILDHEYFANQGYMIFYPLYAPYIKSKDSSVQDIHLIKLVIFSIKHRYFVSRYHNGNLLSTTPINLSNGSLFSILRNLKRKTKKAKLYIHGIRDTYTLLIVGGDKVVTTTYDYFTLQNGTNGVIPTRKTRKLFKLLIEQL